MGRAGGKPDGRTVTGRAAGAGAATLALVLAACGGGGESTPAATSSPSSASPSSPSPTSPGVGTTEAPSPATEEPTPEPLNAADLLDGCTTPTDPGFLTPFVYSSGPPLKWAADPGWSPEETKRAMRKLVRERQRAMSPADRRLSQRVFTRWMPRTDVRLAAAIALVAGYVPRQLFDDFAATFSRIEFAPPSEFEFPEQIAGSFTVLDTGEIVALVNERYRYEDPGLLATTVIVHETFHHDRERTSLEEEATARLFEHLVMLDMVGDHPEMVRKRTPLVRGQLTQLLAMVYNSRTLLAGRCPSILPGADVTVSDFFTEGPIPDNLRSEQTPVSPALRTMWRHHPHLGPPPARHSKAMLRQLQIDALIDTPGDSLDAEDLIRVANAARFQLP